MSLIREMDLNNKTFSIAAVIPTFNRREKLGIILSQLSAQVLPGHLKLHIVVCVDGSSDGTLEMIGEQFPEVSVVLGDGNWWYTRSMNMGFKHAQKFNPDFVLTLNDDLEVGEHYLAGLINDFLSLGDAAVIMGSLSLTNDARTLVHFSGIRQYRFSGFKSEYYHLPLTTAYSTSISGVHSSEELPGRGILIPNNVLVRLNFFDEMFPQYGSDTDFCLRAKKIGIKVMISWNAVVKVNMALTRIRVDSGEESLSTFFKDLFDKNSHYSIHKFTKFQRRHYGLVNVAWSVPLYFAASVWGLLKKKYRK